MNSNGFIELMMAKSVKKHKQYERNEVTKGLLHVLLFIEPQLVIYRGCDILYWYIKKDAWSCKTAI